MTRMNSYSPIEYTESLSIGTVDFVSPDEIRVALNIDAPESLALNTGIPRPFPRINSYLLIPSDEGYLIGQIEWLAIERSPYPKRKGLHDFGLVDLPYPLRKMSLNPVGILIKDITSEDREIFKFSRGAYSFPSVGDQVLLPTKQQLYAIIESGENTQVKIGTSPLADNAEVFVSPDRLFGRHLAVLGNTGSGKSCSVAGLIRWSLESAKKVEQNPNARFIVLDPNGEYSKAFQPDENKSSGIQAQVFKVDPNQGEQKLQIPIWFWNTLEWSAFTQATEKTQRPTLIHALRNVRDGKIEASVSKSQEMRRILRIRLSYFQIEKNTGKIFVNKGNVRNFVAVLKNLQEEISTPDQAYSQEERNNLFVLNECLNRLLSHRLVEWPDIFKENEIDDLLTTTINTHSAFGGSTKDFLPIDADIPRKFSGDSFLRSIEASAEILNVSEYIETLLMRIRTILGDSQIKAVVGTDDTDLTLAQWLDNYLGSAGGHDDNITIIDLSLVPSEVIHIITAVVARMIFEALQRYRKLNEQILPTVMVMEEAHTFVKRYKEDAENQSAAAVCCQVFEKIAREGRKFGLGLVVSSQRPSELSPTVLSQCNTFLLHRISNDRDQDLVKRFVPDNLKGLLRELPSLPSQQAILMGWASELPILVKMNELPKIQQPHSDDPDFWDVWTREKRRDTNWQEIADDWQGIEASDKNEQETTDDSQGEESSNNQEEQESQGDMNGDIPF